MQSILIRSRERTGRNLDQIAPLLDGAMEKLGQKDHDAVVLRFLKAEISGGRRKRWARAKTRRRCV